MSLSEKIKIIIAFVTLLILPCSYSKSQILKDPSAVELIRKCVDNIYNFKFDEANSLREKVTRAYPGHPVDHLLRAMLLYWENYPMIPSSPACESYQQILEESIKKSESFNPSDSAEYILSNICSRGLLLLHYSENNLSSDVFPLAKSSYKYIRLAFDFTDTYDDFYFFTGVYNYYREAYPDAYPIYKPFAMLFPKGNRNKGLNELQIASKKSIILKAEAALFLAAAYQTFENDFLSSMKYSRDLHEHYPANLLYKAIYIKSLLLTRNYDLAEKIINSSSSSNKYYLAQIQIFNGILQEKKYHDLPRAEELYKMGADEIAPFGDYGKEYAAYAYFGLSRISAANNDKQGQRTNRRKALGMADFKRINFDH